MLTGKGFQRIMTEENRLNDGGKPTYQPRKTDLYHGEKPTYFFYDGGKPTYFFTQMKIPLIVTL